MMRGWFKGWALLLVGLAAAAAEPGVLRIEGGEGPGAGKTIVLVAGDEEYRSEESLPMLAKILARHHGFDCEVLFAWDRGGEFINPNAQRGVHGWGRLDGADLMVIATRFRKPGRDARRHLERFLDAGKPVVALRTATHAFAGEQKIGPGLRLDDFGPKIVGEGWVNHHGRHKVEGTRSVVAEGADEHPILRGVGEIFGPTDVYGIKAVDPERGDVVLLRGAVTESLSPDSKPVAGGKNDPMQPIAWIHPWRAPHGAKGRTFATTMGAAVDLLDEDLRRLVVNGVYHLLELEVPKKAEVGFVDPFRPSFYGFVRDDGKWRGRGLGLDDLELGETTEPMAVPGEPEWP